MLRKLIHMVVWLLVFAYLATALAFTEKMEKKEMVGFINVSLMDSTDFQFINRDDVIVVLKKHGMRITGMAVDSINRQAIKEAVQDIPEVRDAKVFYSPDNDLNIKIWQRRPVLRVKTDRLDYYLDETNNPFSPNSPRFTPRVLVFTGSIKLELAQEKLFPLADYIRQDPFFESLVQEIHINSKEQLEIIPRIGNHRIFLGDALDYDWKLTKLMAFYKKALPDLGWDRYSSIDLRYSDQVVCKKAVNKSIN